MGSCYEPNDFPETPTISLQKLEFIDNEDFTFHDTLAITINFNDGDGDLGLSSQSDINFPFNNKFYFTWSEPLKMAIKYSEDASDIPYYNAIFETSTDRDNFLNTYFPTNSGLVIKTSYPGYPYNLKINKNLSGMVELFNSNIITFEYRSTVAELDTLPDFVTPYNCINWEITAENDTLYYQSNLTHNNILVDYYVDEGNGNFVRFNWETDIYKYPQCNTSFNGRFPIINLTGREKSLEGTIRYNMTSLGFTSLFSIKRLKLRIQIIDRHLNRSNVIETNPFRLEDILVK